MPLQYSDELADRLSTLKKDVGQLHNAAVLGFSETDDELLTGNIDALAFSSQWKFIDCRNIDLDSLTKALVQALPAADVALLIDRRDVPLPVEQWTKAVVKKSTHVSLASGQNHERNPQQSLFIVCSGCTQSSDLPDSLAVVPFTEFIA